MLQDFQKIQIENPVDQIINQIRALITSGKINPGDKLPPERKLAETFGVGRGQIRDAIRKLEFYGILKTLPQSGTIVSGIGIVALEGLITDVLQLEQHDFKSLVETRLVLEMQSARMAAIRRTNHDIAQMTNALKSFENKISQGMTAVEEDLLFHIKIAEAGKNNVLKSLMMIITPDIVGNYIQRRVCDSTTLNKTLMEHQLILDHIIDQNADLAAEAMEHHLKDVGHLVENIK